jgi:hypothetical protein
LPSDPRQRLAQAGIHLLAETKTHYLLARDRFLVLVERTESGFGGMGSTGVWTEHGLAYLVWRGERAFLVTKGHEQAAASEEVEAVRRFSAEVRDLIG